jgi:hypothetical protein
MGGGKASIKPNNNGVGGVMGGGEAFSLTSAASRIGGIVGEEGEEGGSIFAASRIGGIVGEEGEEGGSIFAGAGGLINCVRGSSTQFFCLVEQAKKLKKWLYKKKDI